ncbi:MAG: bifunctional [glutamate--ammonia ligase]-adenylyl-L-tyrosine phosphorylase/[glutamate--ammonia-ligase] adenylyltransferase, partial [Pseudomonas sp.]
ITMLGTYTMSGKLYEVDTRLRPSGESGLLVSSMEAFIRYQDHDAWTWEHQALVRARAVAGSKRLQAQFDDIRTAMLVRERDADKLREEVTGMRKRMRDEFARRPVAEREKISFIIKHGRGGIIDIEFIVQYLVLASGAKQCAMVKWSDNVRILESARDTGLLPEAEFQTLTAAYLAQRALLHEVALAQEDTAGTEALVAYQEAVDRVWLSMFPGAA